MSAWTAARATARANFVDILERRSFSVRGDGSVVGSVEVNGNSYPIKILLDNRFPFMPPRVFPETDVPWSWHRELEGDMCLYAFGDRDGLPWLDVDDFLTLVARWCDQSVNGWASDSPDLDLDRYFPSALDKRLVVYGRIEDLVGSYISLVVKQNTIEVIGKGSIPRKQQHKNRLFGYVLDLGRPVTPPRDWPDIVELIPAEVALKLERAIKEERVSILLLRYERNERSAILAVHATPGRRGIILRSHFSASSAHDTLMLRAGTQAEILKERRVCVVGAGAIGSFTCDALVRAGIGALTIRDDDIVRPGNLVRHLVGLEHLGSNKAKAVKAVLLNYPFGTREISSVSDRLDDPDEIPSLFADFDLIVDATADASVTEMLSVAASALDQRFLSACIQSAGSIVRVDVIPPIIGDPLPDSSAFGQSVSEQLFYEGGCASPVSRTPPYAVMQAAAFAARHAVGLLTGSHVHAAGEVQTYAELGES